MEILNGQSADIGRNQEWSQAFLSDKILYNLVESLTNEHCGIYLSQLGTWYFNRGISLSIRLVPTLTGCHKKENRTIYHLYQILISRILRFLSRREGKDSLL